MFVCQVPCHVMLYDCSDVVQIPKTDEVFRLLYDVKGRFVLHRITKEEASVCTWNVTVVSDVDVDVTCHVFDRLYVNMRCVIPSHVS